MAEEHEIEAAMREATATELLPVASPGEEAGTPSGDGEVRPAEPESTNGKSKKKGKPRAKATFTLRPEDDPKLTWTLQKIPLDELFSPKDDRASDEVDPNLVASIQKVGLLEPLLVRWDEEERKYSVIAGKRRLKALLVAGIKEPVACNVVEGQVIPGQDPLIALTENDLREEMSPYDKAKLWAEVLKQTGWTQEELADHYGMSKGTVSEALKLVKAKLPRSVKEQLSRNEISAKAVTRSIDKDGSYNPELLKAGKKGTGENDRTNVVYKTWPDEETGITLVAQGLKKKAPPTQELISAIKNWLTSLEASAKA
jgi:ParB/RepB/Spo0J family partition protein